MKDIINIWQRLKCLTEGWEITSVTTQAESYGGGMPWSNNSMVTGCKSHKQHGRSVNGVRKGSATEGQGTNLNRSPDEDRDQDQDRVR